LRGQWAVEWGGAQRWLVSSESAEIIQEAAKAVGGSASLFRGPESARNAIRVVAPELLAVHKKIKHAFDPNNILNVGKLHPDV
jgi:glycolate oxidase FAD binding subunit